MFLAKKGVKVKRVKIIFACVIAILVCFGLVACQKTIKTNRNNEKTLDSGETDERASVLSIKNGKVDGLDIYLEVSPDIELIDLRGMIKTTKNCSWKLYAAPAVTEDLANATKTIAPSKGNNIYFVVVTSANGKVDRTYRLNVFKNYYATLTFTFDNAVVAQEEVLTHTVYNGLGPVCRDPAFISWDCQGQYIESERTFEAKVKQYEVTFLSSTGKFIEKQNVLTNRLADKPEEPVSEDGLIFSGWNTEDGALWDFDNDVVNKKTVLTAKWEIGKNENGWYLSFGKEKKDVTNNTTVKELNSLAGNLPTVRNPGNWKKRDDGKWYIDVTYNGTQYMGEYNGSYTSWTYYRLLEWVILAREEKYALVMAARTVATKQFDEKGSNNYENSTIRQWLNSTFYDTAFKDDETKRRIKETLVDNSLASTTDEENKHVCRNTRDKVFLLSAKEAVTYNQSGLTRSPAAAGADKVYTYNSSPACSMEESSVEGFYNIYPAMWIEI